MRPEDFEEITTEWRVTWFPDDVPERTRTGSEALVRGLAANHVEFNPIIESRQVMATPWKIEST